MLLMFVLLVINVLKNIKRTYRLDLLSYFQFTNVLIICIMFTGAHGKPNIKDGDDRLCDCQCKVRKTS